MPARRTAETERPKIIVPILVHGSRAHEFSAAIRSVGRHAEQFGHDVEVVVFDSSHRLESQRQNEEAIKHLRKEFQGLPIHYYTRSRMTFVNAALRRIPDKIDASNVRYAYEKLVMPPTKAPKRSHRGHRGSERNALALCAVRHGGTKAVYLHLDDHARLPHGRDELGLFMRQWRQMALGEHGYQAPVIHAETHSHDYRTVTSGPHRPENVGMSGRLYSFGGMTAPFPSTGRNSSELHGMKIKFRKRTAGPLNPLVLSTGRHNQEHLEGSVPDPAFIPPDIHHEDSWRALVRIVAGT